jgi:serine/threonine protein kinase
VLGGTWDPEAQGDITDEYIIFSPLLNATFRSIITNRTTLSASGLERFFCTLLEGVAFLHDHGLCHRDIKPVNILIRSFDPPEALICDFGCLSDKSEIMYDAPGTVPYLAPEQRKGLTHDPTVDYWACGLVGYELLTGEVTYQRVEVGSMLEGYHRNLDAIQSVMAKCCKSMLDANPAMRMPARDAVEALAQEMYKITPISARKKIRTT